MYSVIRKSKRLTTSEDKGQEQHEVENRGDIVDHISNLPDSILHDHILSLLPTKQVVRTSILSTRWKDLWVSAPNIDLDDELLYATKIDGQHPLKVTSFMNFAERVLRLRGELNLKKFKLTSYGFSNFKHYTRIHSWIYGAITHNIQELELWSLARYLFVIPWSILDNTSLVTLKIGIHYVVKLPSHISFPCLKTLHLSSITFMDGDSIQTLLSSCPVLEELVLSDSWWKDSRFLVISSSSLKSLRIHDLLHFESITININAANLIRFDYIGKRSNKILLNNASSLVEACIHMATDKRKSELACRVGDLLKDLRYIASLSVSGCTIESLKVADNMPVPFPDFPNLINLTLTTKIKNYTFGALMDFLTFCPVLQSICFSEGLNYRLVGNKSNWSFVPMCMKNCLKRLTLKKFHGYNSEICFLKCVLKYARVLETMDIWWADKNVQYWKRNATCMKELEKFEMCFLKCVLKHEYILERVDIIWCPESYQRDLKRKTKVRKDFEKIKRSSCVIKFY